MQPPYSPAVAPATAPPRPPLRRPVDDRELAGVCVGLARHLGVHVRVVRLAFVLTALFGGMGLLVYGFLWATIPEEAGAAARTPAARARRRSEDTALWLVVGGVLLVLLGVAILLQGRGFDLRLDLVVPMLVVAAGVIFAWSQLDEATRSRWVPRDGPERHRSLTRLTIGLGLAVVGLLVILTEGLGLAELWNVVVAVLVVLAGVALIVAPWGVRLWHDLRTEQTERIRATERADIAAHLHDSVLQTLALVQRRAHDPAEVTRLARAQERELRSWLYAGPPGAPSTLTSAVTAAAHEVEDLHGVPIELVVTGDHVLDGGTRALVQAVREALLNAVRHGDPPVSAYVEVSGDVAEAFVRDHGPGFDPDRIPPDRLGVRESILGRMARHGGTARVRRLESGTEISLRLPLHRAPPGQAGPRGSSAGGDNARTETDQQGVTP